MEFHIELKGLQPDIEALDEAIRQLDPSALLDVDAGGAVMRVAAAVQATELVALLCAAGYPVARGQVRQLPSTCCGGCSG